MDAEDLYDPRALQGDEGMTEMVLFAHTGKVIQRFARPMLFVAFDPGNAVQVGKKMIDCAVECGAQVEIKVPRREISNEKRKALIARCQHIMRSMQERGKSPQSVARNVVDSILAAID